MTMADTQDTQTSTTPPQQTPPQTETAAPRTRRATRTPAVPSAAGRLEYRRRATAGDEPDLIRSAALVNFWKVMTVLGGIAILWVIVSTSYCAGKGPVTPTAVAPPVVTYQPAPVVAPVATPPAPAPQVIVIPAPQPVQQVVYPPEPPAVNQPPEIETRPPTDAERRNEALKERLRRRYRIE